MTAAVAKQPFNDPDWTFETKLNGYGRTTIASNHFAELSVIRRHSDATAGDRKGLQTYSPLLGPLRAYSLLPALTNSSRKLEWEP
jgi:hypothetical protein